MQNLALQQEVELSSAWKLASTGRTPTATAMARVRAAMRESLELPHPLAKTISLSANVGRKPLRNWPTGHTILA